MLLKFFSRLSWFILFFAAGSTALVTAVLVMTSNGVDVFGIKPPNIPAPTPVSINTTIDLSTGVAASITAAAPLNDVIAKRRIFQSVPLPQEISSRTDVIAANVIFALIFTLIFGAIAFAVRNLLNDPESALSTQLANLNLNPVMRGISRSNVFVQRGCLGLPIILLVFAIYGIIFAFLDQGTYIFSPQGVQLALIMAMSVGLVSLGGDLALRWVSRFWHNDHNMRYGVYPANILVAVFSTAISRVISLSPGILYGIPGGSDAEIKDDKPSRQIALAIGTLLAILFIGGLGWAVSGLIVEWGKTTYNVATLQFMAPIASLLQTAGLAVFAVAIQTAFFEMIPLTATLGSKLYKWQPVAWIFIFAIISFIFAHTILNPASDFYSSFRSANVRAMMLALPALLFLLLLIWGFYKFVEPILNPQRDTPVDQVPNSFEAGMTVPGATLGVTIPNPTASTVMSTRPNMTREELGLPPVETVHNVSAETLVHDTQPGKPIETVVNQSSTDTQPKRPQFFPAQPTPIVSKPGKPKPRSAYPDPTDPYAGLFPPPQPGDEDYLETEFEEDKTPTNGMKPVEVYPSDDVIVPSVPETESVEFEANHDEPPTEPQPLNNEDDPSHGPDKLDNPPPPPDSLPL